MRAFTYDAEIDRTPEQVFAFMTDFSNAPRWRNLVRRMELVTAPPLRQGSEVRTTMDVMGKVREAVSEVWAFDPPRRIGMRNTASGITGTFEYRLEPAGSGTRVQFTCDVKPKGVMWLLLPSIIRSSRSRYRDQLSVLKRELEGST